MTTEERNTTGRRFERLVEIMARLRSPEGCPWDREQTFDTIKPYLMEETCETLDAIDARDWPALAEELGDLLLEVVFLAQMAADAGHFTVDDALDSINAKLVRRHPHVFGTGDAKTADDVKRRWDEIKAEEKQSRGESQKSILSGIPKSLPALAATQQISSKVAAAGFDWSEPAQVMDKLHEEIGELEDARRSGGRAEVEHEIGDMLATVVHLARHLGVDAEQALRKANARFTVRFEHVENNATLPGASLEQMEALWQEAKEQERAARR